MRSILLIAFTITVVSSFELAKLSKVQSSLLGRICPEVTDPENPVHLPHPNECEKFYKCDNKVPVLRRCPSGLWWSSVSNRCEHREFSDCGGYAPSVEVPSAGDSESVEEEGPFELPEGCPANEDPIKPTLLAHPTVCGLFYKCNHGIPVLRRCPSGLWWSSMTKRCEYHEYSDCGGYAPSGEVPASLESESVEEEGPFELPAGCPADEDPTNPTHLAHPTVCELFYKCNHGVPVLRRCPSGLWWSSVGKRCERHEYSDCGGYAPSVEIPSSGESESVEEEGPFELPEGCPADEDPTKPTLLAHPTVCGLFYKCNHGVPVLRRCPSGLWWSSMAKRCEYHEYSDCGGYAPSGEVPASLESESVEEEGPFELPDGCPTDEDPTNPTHLAHPTVCELFYKCNHGVPVLRRCPSGLWWSSVGKRCEHHEYSDCGGYAPSVEVPSSGESESVEEEGPFELPEGCPADEDPTKPTLLAHPTVCGLFYKCNHGVPVLRRCPSGLWWSSMAKRCEYHEYSDCGGYAPSGEVPASLESESVEEEGPFELPDGCPTDEDPTNPTHLAHPTVCELFYKCNHGVPVLRRCPSGLWWSSVGKRCEHHEYSDCGGYAPSVEVPSSGESESVEEEGPFELPEGCPADEDPTKPTLLAHPTVCGLFYKCNHGVPVLRRCPSGLWWSSMAKRCEYHEYSDCGGYAPSGEVPASLESESVEEEGPFELPDGCPTDEDPTNPTHLAHPTVCELFYKCNHGVPVLRRCPSGLWWSSVGKRCEHHEYSDCGGYAPSVEVPSSGESESVEEEGPFELPEGCPADEDPTKPTLLAHPTVCGLFYKCNHGVPVLRRCPSGLWWSSMAKRCEYHEYSDCGGYAPSGEVPASLESESVEEEGPFELPDGCPTDEDPTNPTHLAHPTVCELFYKCNHGVPVLRRCPSGLWWSSVGKRCEHHEYSDCGGYAPSVEVPSSGESESVEEEGPFELPEGCPADEDPTKPTLLAHPTVCGLFYKCNHGVPVLRRCPSGLWWSSMAKRCEYHEYSDCGGYAPSGEVPASLESESVEEEGPFELPDGCPTDEDPTNPTHLAHPTVCELFYKCNHGVPVLRRCPSGLWWSSVGKRCEHHEYSDCGGYAPSVEVPSSGESESVEEEGPFELPEGCPADEDPTKPTLLAHPTVCGLFYKCNHGVPVLRRCPSGLWWSSMAKRCEYHEYSDCGGYAPSGEVPASLESESVEEEGPFELPDGCPTDEDPTNPTHLAHPTVCELFYKCNHGVPVLRRCPSGLWWSSVGKRCEHHEYSDCGGYAPSVEVPSSGESESVEEEGPFELPEGCPADEDPTKPTLLAHPTVCGLFYKCNHGVPFLRRCPSGLWWSTVANRCEHHEYSDCGLIAKN